MVKLVKIHNLSHRNKYVPYHVCEVKELEKVVEFETWIFGHRGVLRRVRGPFEIRTVRLKRIRHMYTMYVS